MGWLAAHIDSAAAHRLHPTKRFELLIGRADGVRVQAKAFGERARAGKALAGSEFAARNSKHELRCELIAERDRSVASEPELHCSHELYRFRGLRRWWV